MADIKRTLSELLIDYADNSIGAITPSKLRNGFKSVFGSTDVYTITSGATYNATADNVVIMYNYTFSQGYILLPAVSATDTSGYTYSNKEYVISNISQFNVNIIDLKDASTILTLGPGDYAYIAADTSAWNVVTKFITSGFVKTDGSNIMTGTLKTPAISAALIEFNTNVSEIPISAGQVRWNPIEQTYDFGLTNGVTGQAFEEFFIPAHNETGSTIFNGTVVYLTSGNDNEQLHVGIASKDSINSKSSIAVATHDVTNGMFAKFTKIGKVRNLNTSACLPGRKIYLGLNGSFTSAEAIYPDYNIEIGYCVIQHATSGIIYVDVKQENSVEDIYNVSITNPSAGDSFIYENNRWINRNFGNITRESTGFAEPENISVVYDTSARTITLTGANINAYWRSNLTPISGTSWTSPAHSIGISGNQFLYYDGTNFVWSSIPWTFDMLQIALVNYDRHGNFVMVIRETHGTMQWQVHRELHNVVGTYLGSGGDLSNYTLNSTEVSARRPTISQTAIFDEDLQTINSVLSTNQYALVTLSGSNYRAPYVDQSDIIRLSGTQPMYVNYTGGNWVETLVPNNNYVCVFVLTVPVGAGTQSQKYRYVFVQPQTIFGNLDLAQAYVSNSLNFGDTSNLITEFVFIGKIIIRYTANDWQIVQVDKLTGSSRIQASVNGTGITSVSHDATLSGAGTATSPLSVSLSLDGLTNVNAPSATNGNALIYVSAVNEWQPYGNAYAWADATQKYYNNEGIWNSTTTIVSVNSATWNTNTSGNVKTWTTAQSAYSVSAIAVVSAMPTSANRVANTLYFLLS